MREGLSSAAADRYCGALQQQIEGSSPKQKYGLEPMSQQFGQQEPPTEKKPPAEDNAGDISIPQSDFETLASFIMNAEQAFQTGEVTPELQDQLTSAVAIINKHANVSEAPESTGPPMT